MDFHLIIEDILSINVKTIVQEVKIFFIQKLIFFLKILVNFPIVATGVALIATGAVAAVSPLVVSPLVGLFGVGKTKMKQVENE